jgi:hypothetical protein
MVIVVQALPATTGRAERIGDQLRSSAAAACRPSEIASKRSTTTFFPLPPYLFKEVQQLWPMAVRLLER